MDGFVLGSGALRNGEEGGKPEARNQKPEARRRRVEGDWVRMGLYWTGGVARLDRAKRAGFLGKWGFAGVLRGKIFAADGF